MSGEKLKRYLTANGVEYTTIPHLPTFTAQQTAAAADVPGQELAKSVIVTLDDRISMCVLPASCEIDFTRLKQVSGAKNAYFAHEPQFREWFPDCERGAMPPFGNLYDVPVYVAETLAEDEEIVFDACTHSELIRMKYADFVRLVKPGVGHFTHKGLVLCAEADGRVSPA